MNDIIYIDNPMFAPSWLINEMDKSINNFHTKLQTMKNKEFKIGDNVTLKPGGKEAKKSQISQRYSNDSFMKPSEGAQIANFTKRVISTFKKSHYKALRIGSYDPSTMMTEDWPKEGRLIIEDCRRIVEWWTSNGNIYGYMLIDKALEP